MRSLKRNEKWFKIKKRKTSARVDEYCEKVLLPELNTNLRLSNQLSNIVHQGTNRKNKGFEKKKPSLVKQKNTNKF